MTYPPSYVVLPQPPEAARPGGRATRTPGSSGHSGASVPAGFAGDDSDAMLDAFSAQGLELVEPFDLVPAAAAGSADAGGRPPGRPGKVRVALDLPEGQNAVILLEQDGFFFWQLPAGPDQTPAGPGRPIAGSPQSAAPGESPQAGHVVRFEIDVRPAKPAPPAAITDPARHVLGPFGDYVIGQVRAYVLKFAARVVPGALMSFLERDLHPGLVLMTGTDVTHWLLVDNLAQVPLPQDRPARILLFVPGTFTTTVGSYGVLTTTAAGRALLTAAAGSYDAVIGFDHRTLSRDPLENAMDLYSRLAVRDLGFPPAIDLVGYSRGGLVARSLIEYVLPSAAWHADIGKVAFVGATNAGTQLAEPDNWGAFIDLYTTLVAATARSVAFATGAPAAAEIIEGLLAGIGAFVKFLVLATVTDKGIPGLAAMEPDGPFITAINGTQPGQPVAGTPWYVVSSDFEVTRMDDRHQPPELPPELVAKLADGLADQLMGVQNDLIVDTASMGAIDLPSGGGFVKDSLAFGTNGVVHHLNYFIQPRVCDALANWLNTAARP